MFTPIRHRTFTGFDRLLFVALTATVATAVVVLAQTTGITRISVDSSGAQANGISNTGSISSDGRFVAFASIASNLVEGDTNDLRDIFVHDRQTGETVRVSVAPFGGQSNGDSNLDIASISADGQVVAFESNATNLVEFDTNGLRDVFVYDRQTGVAERVSVDSAGGEANGGVGAFDPAISPDGRFVTFTSDASNLVADDTNGRNDVFVHDRETGVTERISVGSFGAEANGDSREGRLSADGRFVAFESAATNLVSGDTNDRKDIFVRDRLTGLTERVSVSSLGDEAEQNCFRAAISWNGRFVAFDSGASSLTPGDTDGGLGDVFVHDRLTRATERVSVENSGAEEFGGTDTSISGDGRVVAFEAIRVGPGVQHAYVHDRHTGVTDRLSIGFGGVEPDGDSRTVSISGDGKAVAFLSFATNLVPDDTNGGRDIFVVDRSNQDADGDGIYDSIDTQPAIASSDFSDQPHGGATTGSILTRGDQALLSILDSPRATEGVWVSAGEDQGSAPATIRACTGPSQVLVDVFSGARLAMTCGSFTISVERGDTALTFTVGDQTATASLTAGTGLTYQPAAGTISAPAGAAATIVVIIGGNDVAVAPGANVSVGDRTPPTITGSATTAPNAAGWYSGNVTIHFTCSDTGSGVPAGACPPDQTLSAEGTAVASTARTVTDAAGNTSAPSNIVTVKIDRTAPTLAPVVTPNPVLLNESATATAGAADTLSGVATQTCGAPVTTSVGVKTVTCSATDNAGNLAQAVTSYQVVYPWAGFFQPVDNRPTVNQVKAGSAVPIKFSLGGNRGLSIFAAGYPVTRLIACNSSAPLDDIEQTVTAGASSLTFDAISGQYSYVWKTDKTWANTCRELVLKVVDGTEQSAAFKLK